MPLHLSSRVPAGPWPPHDPICPALSWAGAPCWSPGARPATVVCAVAESWGGVGGLLSSAEGLAGCWAGVQRAEVALPRSVTSARCQAAPAGPSTPSPVEKSARQQGQEAHPSPCPGVRLQPRPGAQGCRGGGLRLRKQVPLLGGLAPVGVGSTLSATCCWGGGCWEQCWGLGASKGASCHRPACPPVLLPTSWGAARCWPPSWGLCGQSGVAQTRNLCLLTHTALWALRHLPVQENKAQGTQGLTKVT